ncbi:NAD(P)H-binding protein [Nonomuraea sp. NBC_01738]|uniref:NAD(P)H-binding protein n=1 Tax=Nonomuraea sp. NBC_01738 TaxID=2976003 RepID=UPI002E0E9CF7|nr:NAD(P)H-binding protein [Nonomuraea sp. NBC_01738]
MTNTTLVLGATGKTGRRVYEQLTSMGLEVRAGSRSAAIPFDWEDERTWAPVLQGVSAVYLTYYPDLAFPGAVDRIRAFTALAAEAGVRRVVLLSGRGEPQAELSERAVIDSGLEWTVVRCSFFMQNLDEGYLVDAVREGVIALPAGDVAEPFVDADDIADVAVAALATDDHVGRVYELTGPRLLTFADLAAELSAVTGREIAYIPLTSEQYAEGAIEAGVPAEEVMGLVELFSEVLDGRNAHLSDGVRQALGRPARDFTAYARAAAPVWKV